MIQYTTEVSVQERRALGGWCNTASGLTGTGTTDYPYKTGEVAIPAAFYVKQDGIQRCEYCGMPLYKCGCGQY